MNKIIASLPDGNLAEYQEVSVFPPDKYRRKDLGLWKHLDPADFMRCRHDFERVAFGYRPPRYGLPRQLAEPGYSQQKPMPQTVMQWGFDPVTSRIYDFVPFTREWQFVTYELMEWMIDGLLEKGSPTGYYWRKIDGKIRTTTASDPYARVQYTPYSMMSVWEDTYSDHVALSDTKSFDNGRRDHIQGRNMSAPDMERKCLLMGGQPIRYFEKVGPHRYFETLDATKPPPKLNWILENKPWLIGLGTEIGCTEEQQLPDGRWTVAMFGKFKPACDALGLERVGTPYFILGRGTVSRVKEEHIMPMSPNYNSPYVP